ncbi:MAG: 50S ribosomal protein L4 [Candidatus Omnitrophica bacterium]|nr:50S ribosomal protein L4 [Candidatus Omnitrophota bacterium]
MVTKAIKTKKAAKQKENKLEAPLYSKAGKKLGSVELPPEVFGVPYNQRFMNVVISAYAGKQRKGTASTKERQEVRGGGRKPWKQKGTGRARASSTRSPIWRGGGTTFGPHPREYGADLPQKMRQKALASALSLAHKEDKLLFIDDRKLDKPKTKELAAILKALKLLGENTLFVVNNVDENLKRASSNLKEVLAVRTVGDVNAYHVLRRKKVLVEKDALPLLKARVLREKILPYEKPAAAQK